MALELNQLETYLEKYRRLLAFLVLSSGCPRDQIDDMLQSIAVDAILRRNNFCDESTDGTEPKSFKAWICSIARNILSYNVKKMKRRSAIASASAFDVAELPDNTDPSSEAHCNECNSLIRQAAKRLQSKGGEMVVLHYLDGLPISEIATRYELSTNAVDLRIRRALIGLRRFLPDENSFV